MTKKNCDEQPIGTKEQQQIVNMLRELSKSANTVANKINKLRFPEITISNSITEEEIVESIVKLCKERYIEEDYRSWLMTDLTKKVFIRLVEEGFTGKDFEKLLDTTQGSMKNFFMRLGIRRRSIKSK